MSSNDEKITELLKSSRIEVGHETYNVVSLSDLEWQSLLENPELSPRMTVPFMIFKDKWEVTMVIEEEDFSVLKHVVRDAAVERGFRLLSFDVNLEFDVIGFMARISKILADHGISLLAISSFSRDHFLIRQDDLGAALKALRGHVLEVC